jgi:hypothetical protein
MIKQTCKARPQRGGPDSLVNYEVE